MKNRWLISSNYSNKKSGLSRFFYSIMFKLNGMSQAKTWAKLQCQSNRGRIAIQEQCRQ